jgi:energy-converting hydrogenase Eha subunit A
LEIFADFGNTPELTEQQLVLTLIVDRIDLRRCCVAVNTLSLFKNAITFLAACKTNKKNKMSWQICAVYPTSVIVVVLQISARLLINTIAFNKIIFVVIFVNNILSQ